jgi:hypothetical protein
MIEKKERKVALTNELTAREVFASRHLLHMKKIPQYVVNAVSI